MAKQCGRAFIDISKVPGIWGFYIFVLLLVYTFAADLHLAALDGVLCDYHCTRSDWELQEVNSNLQNNKAVHVISDHRHLEYPNF